MPQIIPYLTFDGTCAEAMRWYEHVLGGCLTLMTFAQSPMAEQVPPGSGDRILHANLAMPDGQRLLASDTLPGQPYEGIKGVSLSLGYPSLDHARPVFEALADGGRIVMPLQPTFWTAAFGMLVDRYGTAWMVGVEAAGG